MQLIRKLSALTAAAAVSVAGVVALAAPASAGKPEMPGNGGKPAVSKRCQLTPTDGTVDRSLGDRTYHINVPTGLTGKRVPLVVSLHGGQQYWELHESDTGWSDYAAENNFIVAYPEGNTFYRIEGNTFSPSGNTEFLSWDFSHGSEDVTFLRDVVSDISATWCIDPQRVYVEGYSNGAMMATRLACDAADVFAAVASYAGANTASVPGGCEPSRPIAVGIFQSLFDMASLYPIGVDNRDQWIARNGCPTEGEAEPGVLLEAVRYAPCDAGVEVVWRVYALNSHNWPYGADAADIRERMWALFQRNPMP